MPIIDIVIYAFALATDATVVSIANGVCYPSIRKRKMFLMAGLFALFQFLMPIFGYYFYTLFVGQVTIIGDFSKVIAFVLLAVLGIKMLIEGVQRITKNEGFACDTSVKEISFKRLMYQAVATSIDALAVGISYAIAYPTQSIYMASLVIGVVTFALSIAGVFFGARIGVLVSKYAPIIGGVALIFVGLKILIGF